MNMINKSVVVKAICLFLGFMVVWIAHNGLNWNNELRELRSCDLSFMGEDWCPNGDWVIGRDKYYDQLPKTLTIYNRWGGRIVDQRIQRDQSEVMENISIEYLVRKFLGIEIGCEQSQAKDWCSVERWKPEYQKNSRGD